MASGTDYFAYQQFQDQAEDYRYKLAQQMNSPSLIIIGRVVGLRDKLNWFSNH